MLGKSVNGKSQSMWNPSIICWAVTLGVVCCSIWGCSGGDRLVDCASQQEVVGELRGLEESLGYAGIVKIFGKPSDEFSPPSNPDEEFVLYYRCREDAARGFWIMLHYPEKTYWYSSGGVVDIGAPFCGNHLVKVLYRKGASPSATEKLILEGSDSGFGSDIKVAITDADVITGVWKAILNSQYYGVYSACGYRKIQFHSAIEADTPLATLTVLCENDAAYLEEQQPFEWDAAKGGREGLYQCDGLDELIEPYLREEYSGRRQVRSGEGSRS